MSSLSFNSFSLKNPNMAAPPCFQLTPLHSSSPSLHFQPSSSSLVARASSRLSVDFLLPPLRPTSPFTYIVASAASRNKSASHDSQVDKNDDDLDANNEESEEAWKKALESFKEQAIHMKGVSEEAYQVYSKKAMVILEETSQQLKIQADKARKDLNSWAKEVNEAAENSPQEVKEILDTISSSTDVKDISELKDYHVGIGYGSILFAGGFATFMLVGSISAIRFGVILGGALLALGITSRRAQKNGQSYDLALKGQAAIAALLSLRKITLLFQRGTLVKIISAVISSAVFAFYCYRIGALKGNDGRGTNSAQPAEE